MIYCIKSDTPPPFVGFGFVTNSIELMTNPWIFAGIMNSLNLKSIKRKIQLFVKCGWGLGYDARKQYPVVLRCFFISYIIDGCLFTLLVSLFIIFNIISILHFYLTRHFVVINYDLHSEEKLLY